jgi:hypothetical protein
MNLFGRSNQEDVPTIQVQGEEATIPQPVDDNTDDASKTERQIKLPKKTWGRP